MEKRFLSIAQASEYSSLSARLLYQLIHDRKIKHYRVGKRIVIDSEDLENFMREEAVEPIDWNQEVEKMR